MALADVLAKTTITGFSAAQKTALEGVITTAYNGSDTAKAMFEDWIATAGHTIDIKFVAGVYQAFAGTGRVELDPAYISDLMYVNDTGKPVLHSLLGATIHELAHALHGTRDNITATEYQGDNVKFTNIIWKDLGLDQEISYIAQSRPAILTNGYQYTNGAAIDAAESGDRDWSSAPRGNSKDLLIGGPSGNTLQGGDGDDFLVGAGGNDALYGGTGVDKAVYFDTNPADYDIRRSDDGTTWTVRQARGDKKDGADTLTNVEDVQFGAQTFHLAKNGLSFQTDFAFVIDTTGSMGDDIAAVKSSANDIINRLFADGKTDARIGIVGFKDTTIGEASTVILPFTDQDSFADRKAAALAAINSIGVGGGGDLPETDDDGLLHALNGDMGKWRVGAGDKVVVLFTDAAVKDVGLRAQVDALAHNIGATISGHSSAVSAGGQVDTFYLTDASAAGLDPTGDPEDDPIPPFVFSSDPATADPSGSTLKIFTIYTGPSSGVDTSGLHTIAESTGGSFLTAPTPADLVKAIFDIIDLPPADPDLILEGGPGNDVLTGLSGSDLILGRGGDDTMTGAGGNDTMFGEGGNDTADGGAGNDVMVMGDGTDSATGGPGNDYAYLGNGDDIGIGGAGVDVLLGEGGNDTLYGGDDTDYLFGGAGTNVLVGDAGVDVLESSGTGDVMYGGEGGDYFYSLPGAVTPTALGGNGNDIYTDLSGGAGTNDTFYGEAGQDYCYGFGGNDTFYGGAGVDVFLGGAGDDTFDGGTDTDYAWGEAGNDTFITGPANGVLVLNDFAAGGAEDSVRLVGSGFSDFGQVLAAMTYFDGLNTTILTIDADTNVWFIGVQPGQFTGADFQFA